MPISRSKRSGLRVACALTAGLLCGAALVPIAGAANEGAQTPESTLAETTPAETTPAQTPPAETTPTQQTTTAETTPTETAPTQTTPTETTPTQPPPQEQPPQPPLAVTIVEPEEGEAIEPGERTVTVRGRVSLAPVGVGVDTLFVMDVSRSTDRETGGCGDANGDKSAGTVLDCEIASALALHGNFEAADIEVGVISFGSDERDARNEDVVRGRDGTQRFAPSAADGDEDGTPDVEQALRDLRSEAVPVEGSVLLAVVDDPADADFEDALTEVTATLASRPADRPRVAFLFSDGFASEGDYADALADARDAGISIHTFHVGGGNCSGVLGEIAAATGGTCRPVQDPATLSDFNALGLDEVLVSLNGGTPVRAPVDPVGVFFGTFTTPLSGTFLPGENTIAAVAQGRSASSSVILTAAAAQRTVPPAAPPAAGGQPSPPPPVPPADPPPRPPSGDGRGTFRERTLEIDGLPGDPLTAGTLPPFTGPGPTGTGEGLRPVLGETAVVGLVRGTVFIRFPSGELIRLARPIEIPLGSSIDTRRGEIRITTVKDRTGALQTGDFFDGIFVLTQDLGAPPVTELTLESDPVGPSVRGASHRKNPEDACRDEMQRLWGETDGEANFRTRGNFSASVVRGTRWLTQDCSNGTSTHVRDGTVRVFDLVRRVTVILTEGEGYLARPAGSGDSGSRAGEPAAPRS